MKINVVKFQAEDEDICRLMLCHGDGDGYCWYYPAAMGTPCGQPSANKVCYVYGAMVSASITPLSCEHHVDNPLITRYVVYMGQWFLLVLPRFHGTAFVQTADNKVCCISETMVTAGITPLPYEHHVDNLLITRYIVYMVRWFLLDLPR